MDDLSDSNLHAELEAAWRRIAELETRLAAPSEVHEEELPQAESTKVQDHRVRQARLATLEQVTGSVAHELRNPLGLIRNALYMLRRQFSEESQRCAPLLEIIDGATTEADRALTDLTAMSRGTPPVRQVVDLKAIVNQARGNLRRAERASWVWEADPDPFLVAVDPSQFEQVLRNLASNAVEAAAQTLQMTARRTARGDEIVVADDGPGIPVELRAQIFEPLYTTKRLRTGLGLTVCRQIVHRHDGTIEFLPTPQGAAFLIRLPSSG